MVEPSAPIRFYFDYISPYAYLAWTQIHALASRHGREVEPIPVLFAALLDANGQRGPAEIPRKRLYVFKDAMRLAFRFGVPIGVPPSHPFNPLLALRASSLPMPKDAKRRLIDALYAATWGGAGSGVDSTERVAAAANAAGLDGDAIVREATTPEAKERLKKQTDQALTDGAFGVPTLVCEGELFWGVDSFPHLELLLTGKDPIAGIDLLRWADLPASAERRGKR